MKTYLKRLLRLPGLINLCYLLAFVWAISPVNVYASEKFLTLPFKSQPKLMQGWYYDFGSRSHQGIDYYSAVGSELLATNEGSVKTYFQPGKNFVYGKYLILDGHNGYRVLYAHIKEFMVKSGSSSERGNIVALSGMTGTDNPHLHFEVLAASSNGRGVNRGYGWRTDPYDIYGTGNSYPFNGGYKSVGANSLWMGGVPCLPITKTPKISATVEGERDINITWDNVESAGLTKVQLFRSNASGGTMNPSTRTEVFSASEGSNSSYIDKGVSPGTYYYSALATYQSGLSVQSQESSSITVKRIVINITDNKYWQGSPSVQGDKVYWVDHRKENDKPTKKLYRYNINTKEVETFSIGIDGVEFAENISANSSYACYDAYDKYSSAEHNIYCVNLETSTSIYITQSKGNQYVPVVTKSGLVIWVDRRKGNESDLWALDLASANGEFPYVEASGNQTGLAVWGDTVAWKDSRLNAKYDIYAREGLGEERILATSVGSGSVDLWEDWVVWNDKNMIYALHTGTGEKVTLDSKYTSVTVRVGYGKLVYASASSGLFDLSIYDLASKKTEKFELGSKYYPIAEIGQGFVVFDHGTTDTSSDSDIYIIYF